MENGKFYELASSISRRLYQPITKQLSLDRWKMEMIDLIEEIGSLKLLLPESCINNEQSLDPADWYSARNLAHRVLDSSLDLIEFRRNFPVWQPIPQDIRHIIENEPCPKVGQPLSLIAEEMNTYVTPYGNASTHPKFWGWVTGEGTLGGILGEITAASMNNNAGLCASSGILIERRIIHWMREIFEFPVTNHGGIIVSGTTFATMVCLATARRRLFTDVRQKGMMNGPHLITYASKETHACVTKALEILGLGSNSLHSIPVDENFAIDINALKLAIENDRSAGLVPLCIIGNAGTVNTGAFDNLVELGKLARNENIWFHVDGAFGALIILDPERRHLVNGIENANSLAFDFHKWLHCPYDAGCVLVREETDLLSTFSLGQSYLAGGDRGCAIDKPWFCELGPELSRCFRALKVWCTLKEHGIIRLGEKIADNCQQAQYLGSLLAKHESIIQTIRPIKLNIVNFRFESEQMKSQMTDGLIDQFNSDLLADLQISGKAVASTTRINQRLYIRVSITSHRCILNDFDDFLNDLICLYQSRIDIDQ